MQKANYELRLTNYALIVGVVIALISVVAGALLGFTGILITVIAIVAVAASLWALTDMEIGLWGMVAIIALLPFGALPFKIVFTPTFLDLAMGGVLLVYAMQWMSGRRYRLTTTPAQDSMVFSPSGRREESPKPMVSMAIALRCLPSSGSTSRYSSHERGVWWSRSTGLPSPATAQCTVPAGTATKRRSTVTVMGERDRTTRHVAREITQA